jgi:hypothetical protein
MKKTEMRPKDVFYCDYCGSELRQYNCCDYCDKHFCIDHSGHSLDPMDSYCLECGKLTYKERVAVYRKAYNERIEKIHGSSC